MSPKPGDDWYRYPSPNPGEGTGLYARENEYKVRIYIDTDELDLPFIIRAGKDYGNGDNLATVALKLAEEVVNAKWSGVNELCKVAIYASYPTGLEPPCKDDDEPLPLATATAYRW